MDVSQLDPIRLRSLISNRSRNRRRVIPGDRRCRRETASVGRCVEPDCRFVMLLIDHDQGDDRGEGKESR